VFGSRTSLPAPSGPAPHRPDPPGPTSFRGGTPDLGCPSHRIKPRSSLARVRRHTLAVHSARGEEGLARVLRAGRAQRGVQGQRLVKVVDRLRPLSGGPSDEGRTDVGAGLFFPFSDSTRHDLPSSAGHNDEVGKCTDSKWWSSDWRRQWPRRSQSRCRRRIRGPVWWRMGYDRGSSNGQAAKPTLVQNA
jgi:hypothetical protein